DVFPVGPDFGAAVWLVVCLVVGSTDGEMELAVVHYSGWLVGGFWFEDFSEEAFHRGSWSYGFSLCPLMSAVPWPSLVMVQRSLGSRVSRMVSCLPKLAHHVPSRSK